MDIKERYIIYIYI